MKTLFQLLFLITWLLAFPCKAQYHFDHARRISTAEGLPSEVVNAFAEDRYGFVWIGTGKGLCRYDGSQVFQVKPSAPDSVFLPSESIRSLFCKGDSLFIGTEKGLSILDLKSWHFKNVDPSRSRPDLDQNIRDRFFVRDIYEDRQGDLWLAPAFEGFVRWDTRADRLDYFPLTYSEAVPKVHSLTDQLSIRTIQQDIHQDSIFWGITAAELVRLNAKTGQMTRIRYKNADSSLEYQYNRHICMYQHSDGKIYMGQWSVGMIVYDPATGSFYIPENQLPDFEDRVMDLGHGFDIYPKSKTELYFTYARGLYLYHTERQTLHLVQNNQQRDEVPKIYGVKFIDSRGIAWYGTGGLGVFQFDPVAQQFGFYSFKALNPSPVKFLPRGYVAGFFPGYLTFAGQYSDGLYSINLETGHRFKIPAGQLFVEEADFLSWGLIRLNEDELLVSEKEGLYHYKRGAASLVPFEIQPPLTYRFFGNLAIDSMQRVWIGTSRSSLWSIDLPTKEIRSYASQVPPNTVTDNFIDQSGNVWFTSGSGHVVYARKEDRIYTFDYRIDSLATQGIGRNFCQCPDGTVLWGGEENGLGRLSAERPEAGLIQLDVLRDSVQIYPVSGVVCDKDNTIWVLSRAYLLKLDQAGAILEKYSYRYGLGDYTYSLFDILPNGRLLIGGRDGIYVFDPDNYRINEWAPVPYVFEVSTNKEKKQNYRGLAADQVVVLSPSENVLNISFSAINFTFPTATTFQYRMEGVDEDWQQPGGNRSITYTNLKGGDYRFLLKASNNEGIWSKQPATLAIHVGTPWYKTAWFYGLLALMGLGLIYLIYNFRVRQIQKESRLKADFENQIATIEMSALRAQMNPHFIFNCLNSIELYIIKNDTQKAAAYLSNFSRLVRLILQNSRSNFVNLKDELEALELYIKLEQMRFRYSFDYVLDIEPGLDPEDYDIPPMLIQPFIENAIWHGLNQKDEKGKVQISIRNGEEVITCTIEDDGIGRVASERINAAKKVKRKSMGMSITQERIDIINKLYNTNNQVEIQDLYSPEGAPSGTRVIINIPI